MLKFAAGVVDAVHSATGLQKILTKVGSLGLVATAAIQNCSFAEITPSTTLAWCLCGPNFFCAKLDVPLDYQNVALGRASVPLIKYAASSNSVHGPYQGMILINPGGPGGSGITQALNNGSEIQAAVGTNWDIVGFDPRGMWLSEPVANCSVSFNATRIQSRSVPRVLDEYFESFIDYGHALGASCAELAGGPTDAGPHMSTSVTARDMLSVVDAFASTADGKQAAKDSRRLNYYGYSYGSFLGQTFASMFPHRVGNLVIDAIASPEGYLANFTNPFITHLDGVLASFFLYCHAAGKMSCPYRTGSTPKDVFYRFNRSFQQLNPGNAKVHHWTNATEIESALLVLKSGLLNAAYKPIEKFAMVAHALLDLEAALATRKLPMWIERYNMIMGDPTPAGHKHLEWTTGVICSDQRNMWYNKTLEDLRPNIQVLKEQSIIGELWMWPEIGCLGWPIKAKEVFSGPFGGDTATPILFISNSYDPVTPIENAHMSVPNYKGAQMLTVDGAGHGALVTKNQCFSKKLRAYFQETILPGKDNFCALEAGPFGVTLEGTLRENIERAGLSNLQSTLS